MKNKKSLLSLGLLALVLVLGVGYAVVSNVNLTIGGSATVEDAQLKVSFKSVDVTKTGSAEVTNTLTEGAISDTFTITKMTLNETVTLTYTVKNEETDVVATLAEKVALTNDNEDYFEASYKIDDANIAAGGTTTVTVTVKLIKTPVTTAQGTGNFSVTLEAAPVNG